jgi:hypothetical protein
MPNHMIGIGGLPQRAALVALLPAARLARAASQTARDPRLLLQPVARRRLGTVRTVLSQLSTKISDFSLEYRDLALQRSDQLIDFGGKIHPTLDSDSQPQVSQVPLIERKFAETVVFRTHPTLGVTKHGLVARSETYLWPAGSRRLLEPLARFNTLSLRNGTGDPENSESPVSLVAGGRNTRPLRNAKGDPSGSPLLVSQESLVAGARNTGFLRLVESAMPKLAA